MSIPTAMNFHSHLYLFSFNRRIVLIHINFKITLIGLSFTSPLPFSLSFLLSPSPLLPSLSLSLSFFLSFFCFTFEPCCVECSPTNDRSELPAPVLGNLKSNICNVMEHSTQVIPSEGFFFRERKMVDRIGAGCFRQGAESRRETKKQGYIKSVLQLSSGFPSHTLSPVSSSGW